MLRLVVLVMSVMVWLPAFAQCDPAIRLEVGRPEGTEAEPTVVYAKAISGCRVTAMRVYVDYKLIYEQHGQSTINARLVMGRGFHRVVVQAWNSAGTMAKNERYITSEGDPVEPIVGCESDRLGAFFTGASIPYIENSPAQMGMVGRTDAGRITSMRLYVDGVDRAQVYGTSGYCLPAALISLKPGYHFINVQGWDSFGRIHLGGSIVKVDH